MSWYEGLAMFGLGMFVAVGGDRLIAYWQNNWKDKL